MKIKEFFSLSSGVSRKPEPTETGEPGPVYFPCDEELDNFVATCNDNVGWKERYNKDNVTVYTKYADDSDSKIKVIKARAFYTALSADLIFDVLMDGKYRHIWDKMMIEGADIGMVGPTSDLTYYSAKLPSPIKNRDFLLQRSWRVEEDFSEVIIKSTSVSSQLCPERKDFIRALSMTIGYHIQNLNGGCILTYLTHTDPKGSLPAYFVNKLVTKLAPSVLHNLKDICLKYVSWKNDHHPDLKPWRYVEQITSPYIDIETDSLIQKSTHPFLIPNENDQSREEDSENDATPHIGLEMFEQD